jgi:hypothetical protein
VTTPTVPLAAGRLPLPEPSFEHIVRMTDQYGMFEHADGVAPRVECGYCLDDVARALVVVCREPAPTPVLCRLAGRYLANVGNAQAPDGRCHNRLDRHGQWEDQPGIGDWWGRALWGLGTAAARGPSRWIRQSALTRFEISVGQRSPDPHAMAFAALGAAEVLDVHPGHRGALGILSANAALLGRITVDSGWPWPQPRLSYASAAIAEGLIAAGAGLGDDAVLADGLALLAWLLDIETGDGHLSVTAVGGWAPGESRVPFDQQPIEAAALADACARAFALTGEPRWESGLRRAVGWFLGDNDCRLPLYDPASGGGYDALTPGGRNTNQGAESTLALTAALQHGRRLPLR